MQPLQICIGPSIRIGRESWCLPYAGFLVHIAPLRQGCYSATALPVVAARSRSGCAQSKHWYMPQEH